MIWFYFYKKKKMFSVLGVAYGDHIVAEVGLKMVIFWGWTKNGNFLSIGFQLQLLILIESSNIFRWKPARKTKVWSWGKFGPN